MVTTVRQTDITNSTNPAALIPSGNAAIVCNKGQDYAFEIIERTFIAEEIGTDAGQTQDTTSDPTVGFLFAQFQGCSIRKVVSAVLKKSIEATNDTTFDNMSWGAADADDGGFFTNLAWRVVNPSDSPATAGFHQDYASLYLLDTSTDASVAIAAGDKVIVQVLLGQV